MAAIQNIDGRLKILLLPFRQEQAVGIAPDPAVDGQLFAYDDELIYVRIYKSYISAIPIFNMEIASLQTFSELLK